MSRLTLRACVTICICAVVLTLAQLFIRTHSDVFDLDLSEGRQHDIGWAFVPMKLAPGQKQVDVSVLWKPLNRDSNQHDVSNTQDMAILRKDSARHLRPEPAGGRLARMSHRHTSLGTENSGELLAAFRNWQGKHSQTNMAPQSSELHQHSGSKQSSDHHEMPYFSFMHIPRTAGASILAIFRKLLNCPSKCSCREIRKCQSECPRLIHQCGHSTELLPNWFVKAHSGPVPLISFTMLRDPIVRLNSVLRVAQQTKGSNKHVKSCCGLPSHAMAALRANTPLDEFAEAVGVSNAMTRMLAGYESSDGTVAASPAMLDTAKRRLMSLSFFGLVERFNDSVKLLLKTLRSKGVELPGESVNDLLTSMQSSHKQSRDVKTVSSTERLSKVESFDISLYKFAKELFEKRLCDSHITCSEHAAPTQN